ncbi:2OG-Fe(II) oxygenase [Flavisphingomonas formosensis]|uniref:2OG-Fe(II) oxygenase n=1 Tax=Flavisphingomonas formosensis TaxID=861534 RepID=UPI0012FC4093|nr:2OG-Fe(II) oxygenase [Sphingomonas formosensis]
MLVGDFAPSFRAPALQGNPNYVFDTAAGRPVMMLFFGSAANGQCRAALDLVAAHRPLFDDVAACFFGVTIDPQDSAQGRIVPQVPGLRFLLDHDRQVSLSYGAVPDPDSAGSYRPHWLVLDHALQVAGIYPLGEGLEAIAHLERLIAGPRDQLWAPVLQVPRIFEPELCRKLIELYDTNGGAESGFMREVDGRTVYMTDANHKRRSDYNIEDELLRRALIGRINVRLVPRLRHAFQYNATRIERHIVACYDGGSGGYFRPHRDNTTKGTAHRRFAVTINLNADDYEGGELRFPEYGPRAYRAPTGGAIVFSCSMLHEALPVRSGRRYAYLPFLYDDAGARLREENSVFLGDGIQPYRAGFPVAGDAVA